MLKNYLEIAVRHLVRHAGYALINITGLAIGLACCILIFLYVQYELGYDRYHEKADRIYRVINGSNAKTSSAMLPALKRAFPEIVTSVRIRPPNGLWLMQHDDKVFYEERAYYAEPTLFEMFDFELIKGDPRTALYEPSERNANSIVISESMARKYFGAEDPMGKVITAGGRTDLTVTGVMKDVPSHSHFAADFFVSTPPFRPVWWWRALYTYVLIPENVSVEALQRRIDTYVDEELGPEALAQGHIARPWLQPLTDIHLRSHLENEADANSDIVYVYILSSIAVLILLIACINFMNLATARSVNRAREVGMRKVVGASRPQLMGQFIGESVLFTALALALALALVHLSMPMFNALTDKALTLSYTAHPTVLPGLVFLTLCVGLVAGSYPALFLSAFQPVTVLKGAFRTGRSSIVLRKALVVVQFILSIVLIIGAGVISDQLDYVRNKPLGYDKEHVMVVPTTIGVIHNRYFPFKDALSRHPGILGVTRANSMPAREGGRSSLGTYMVRPQDADEEVRVELQDLRVEPEFLETLGLELVAGRTFSGQDLEWNDPAAERNAYILNETAVKQLGWTSPEEAISRQLELQLASVNRIFRGPVIGVVRDFHMASLQQKIEPILIEIGGPSHFAIRLHPEQMASTIAFIEDTWQQIYPEYPFVYSFLDDDFYRLHRNEATLHRIFEIFTLIAVFIACLGLFGLASFTAEQRTREIGIRKVLGASVPCLVRLLTREVVLLVLLAVALAWPLAYMAMERWLQGFVYRTAITWETFLAGGALALIIAVLTVGYQALRAARANPIDALRYE